MIFRTPRRALFRKLAILHSYLQRPIHTGGYAPATEIAISYLSPSKTPVEISSFVALYFCGSSSATFSTTTWPASTPGSCKKASCGGISVRSCERLPGQGIHLVSFFGCLAATAQPCLHGHLWGFLFALGKLFLGSSLSCLVVLHPCWALLLLRIFPSFCVFRACVCFCCSV